MGLVLYMIGMRCRRFDCRPGGSPARDQKIEYWEGHDRQDARAGGGDGEEPEGDDLASLGPRHRLEPLGGPLLIRAELTTGMMKSGAPMTDAVMITSAGGIWPSRHGIRWGQELPRAAATQG